VNERVLVIKVRALGDTLLATPAIHALRRHLPQARITAMVSPTGQAVLANNPDLDEIRIYDKQRHGFRYQFDFIRSLRQARFSTAVALHASFRTAALAWLSGAPQRVVHNHSGRNFFATISIPAKKESKSAIERDLDAVRALGIAPHGNKLIFPLQAADIDAGRTFLQAHGIRQPFLVLIPGAGRERKRWTAAPAAIFLDRMRARLPADWVIVAGPEDKELALAIQGRAQLHPPIFSGTIHGAGALLAESSGAVAMDSGPKHVAVAVGTPTLTLWTDEPEAEWHPYDLERHALVRSTTGLVADIAPDAVAAAAAEHFNKFLKVA
jgi:ADP-heptose:LPS heptosyltransferase